MLTRTAAAVKFDLSSTPEQQACSMHIDEGLKTFWSLVERLQNAADPHQPIHQAEETIFRDLLVVGRWMLRAFLDLAGPGDVTAKLAAAGCREAIFSQRAVTRLHFHSRGSPSGLDRLASLCLMAGAYRGLEAISSDVVEGVLGECHQPAEHALRG